MLTLPVGSHKAFERSFDFSKFPHLEEVDFVVGWKSGGISWIPAALSTLKPATSPRLASLQLHLSATPSTVYSPETLIKDIGNDLRWVADEVARIEREFKGAVKLTVARGRKFKAVFDTLNVRPYFCRVDSTS